MPLPEDDPFQRSLQDHLLELPEGQELLQWHKLFVAFRMPEEAERALGERYDRVYKLRTDLVFEGDVLEDLQRHECRPDEFAVIVARLRSHCRILKPTADLAQCWIHSVHRLLDHAAAWVPACGEERTRSDLRHIQAVLAGKGLPGPEEIGGLLRVGRTEPAVCTNHNAAR